MTPFEKYCAEYNLKFEEYLKSCPDGDEIDFLESEGEKYQWVVFEYENREFLIEGGERSRNDEAYTKSEYLSAYKIIAFLLEKKEALKPTPDESQIIKKELNFTIKGKLNFKQIESYFMQLNAIHSDYPNDKGKLICVLNTNQINELLHSDKIPQKFDTPNFSQQQLRVFIYQLMKLHTLEKKPIKDFVNFEVSRFKVFEGTTPEVEYTNFNKGSLPKLSDTYLSFINKL